MVGFSRITKGQYSIMVKSSESESSNPGSTTCYLYDFGLIFSVP